MAAMTGLAFGDLLLFARVAAPGTLSAVARERDVPVSQVSRTLSRIEKTCAARLIHRSTHGLALTAEGEIFLGYCQRITATVEELEGEFADQALDVRGSVRVAASTVIAQVLLLPSLADLSQRHPQLRVELEVSDRLADMARDRIDIAIRTSDKLPDHQIARRIGSLGRALYASPAYLSRAGTPNHPDDLRRHRLITNSAATQLNHWPFNSHAQRLACRTVEHPKAGAQRWKVFGSLSGLGSVGFKLTAAVNLKPASWPIASAMSRRIRQKLSSLEPILAPPHSVNASTPQARQAPSRER